MTYYGDDSDDDLPFMLRWSGARELVERQRRQLKKFDDVETMMEPLVNDCKAVRDSVSRRRRRVSINEDKLQSIIASCEQTLLRQVPEGSRFLLTMEANDRTTQYVEPIYEDLCELLLPAHLEIGLRVLIPSVIRATIESCDAGWRLPAWNRAIALAESRVARTVEAWNACAMHINPGRNSHGD